MTPTPVNQRASCPAKMVARFRDEDDETKYNAAGDFQFCNGYDGTSDVAVLFGCPCGCGTLQGVHIKPYPADNRDGHAIWQWDGNRECPTLTPSILIHQLNELGEKIGEHWHGYLTAGEFRSC